MRYGPAEVKQFCGHMMPAVVSPYLGMWFITRMITGWYYCEYLHSDLTWNFCTAPYDKGYYKTKEEAEYVVALWYWRTINE